MQAITLTPDQENALTAFVQFLTDPTETVFVLEGYSGTGKTTLIRELLDRLPSLIKTARLINAKIPQYSVQLTATTNKAAETFAHVTGMDVATIHSFLKLRVSTDYRTGVSSLTPTTTRAVSGYLLFIDEASYIDKNLLSWIFKLTENCKIVFMGDPAQLTPVKSQGTPVFDANFAKAKLEQVVRQAKGNPIVDLSTKFRETVNNGQFFQFKPDGHHIQHLSRDEFHQAVLKEFTRSDWHYADSKILAWTNKRVVEYNHFVSDHVKGDPSFRVGDYAMCNKYISVGRQSIKTDQLVCITGIGFDTEKYGVKGNLVTLDYRIQVFFPKSLNDKKLLVKQARAADQLDVVRIAEDEWIDLRAVYACTVNKAQGSTYDKVFIDLDDISRCNSGDQIARMLYVAVSRARDQVFLTGDIA